MGLIPGCVIPRMLKMYKWLPCLALSNLSQGLASLLPNGMSSKMYENSLPEKSLIIISLYSLEDCMEDWHLC